MVRTTTWVSVENEQVLFLANLRVSSAHAKRRFPAKNFEVQTPGRPLCKRESARYQTDKSLNSPRVLRTKNRQRGHLAYSYATHDATEFYLCTGFLSRETKLLTDPRCMDELDPFMFRKWKWCSTFSSKDQSKLSITNHSLEEGTLKMEAAFLVNIRKTSRIARGDDGRRCGVTMHDGNGLTFLLFQGLWGDNETSVGGRFTVTPMFVWAKKKAVLLSDWSAIYGLFTSKILALPVLSSRSSLWMRTNGNSSVLPCSRGGPLAAFYAHLEGSLIDWPNHAMCLVCVYL